MSNRFDNFNRADSALALGSPPDGGSSWSSVSGTWGISSNRGYNSGTPNNNQHVAALESSASDVAVEVIMDTVGGDAGVVARLADDNNYILQQFAASSFNIYKKVAGSFTLLSTWAGAGSISAGSIIKLVVNGTSIKGYVNGIERTSATDAAGQTNTKHGIRENSSTLSYFQNFNITDLGTTASLLDSLISYWPLDEASGNALDVHGQNNLTENGTIGTATGISSSARDFESGDTDFFSLADTVALSMGDIDFSFAAWIKLESFSDFMYILSKGVSNNIAANLEYGLYVSPSGELAGFVSNGSSIVTATQSASMTTGVWYFCFFYYDATANLVGVSVNNAAATTASETGGAQDSTGTFRMGAGSSSDFRFDGLIDQVGIWKRVLTTTERTALYNGGAGFFYPFLSVGAGLRRRVIVSG